MSKKNEDEKLNIFQENCKKYRKKSILNGFLNLVINISINY